MSATVGTRWHLMSSDDLSSLSNLVSTTCESSESASQTYNPFYNIPPITSAYQTTYKSQFLQTNFVYLPYNKNYTKLIGKGNINMSDFKYVFGPIPSRRLGRSLGISPLPKKTCNYSCIYCQLGRTDKMTNKRQEFYKT